MNPDSAFHACTLPSVDPEMTKRESGVKQPSMGTPLLLRCPAKVCMGWPSKASRRRITEPFVVSRMNLPWGEKRRPVHSHLGNGERKS